MEYTEHELSIKQDLQLIYKFIQADEVKKNKAMLQVIISEVIDKLRTNVNRYEVPFTNEKESMHLSKFAKISRKAKAKTIAELEEISGDLNSKTPDTKRCMVLLEGIIETDLHNDSVQKIIDNWQPLTNRKLQIKHMAVK